MVDEKSQLAPVAEYILALQSYIVTWTITQLLDLSGNTWKGWIWPGDAAYPTTAQRLSLCIIGPLFEELAFRKILLGWMLKRWNRSISLIASSVIFAAAHIQYYATPLSFVGVLIIGLSCGYCYLSFNSIWPGFVLHAIKNALMLSPMTSLHVFLYNQFNGERPAFLLCLPVMVMTSIGTLLTISAMHRESQLTNGNLPSDEELTARTPDSDVFDAGPVRRCRPS